MHNIYKMSKGECYKGFSPAKEYTTPSADAYIKHNEFTNQQAVQNAMNGGYGTDASEKAWTMRCGGSQKGAGYTLKFNQVSPGMSERMRYTKSCEPVMDGAGCGCGPSPVMKQNGGMMVDAVNSLGKLIAPLGVNELATLVVLLFLNDYMHKKDKKQKGGMMNTYVDMLVPMGKNNLVVLASLLLLNHFAHKNRKTSKKQSGGADILSFLDELLAPLGVNAFGTAWLLVILNEAFAARKNKSKKQKGGVSEVPLKGGQALMELIAPMGVNAFLSTSLLVLLNDYFATSTTKSKKSQKGGVEYKKIMEMIASYKKGGASHKKAGKKTPVKKTTTKKKPAKKTTPKKKPAKKTTPKKKPAKKKTPKKEGFLSFLGL